MGTLGEVGLSIQLCPSPRPQRPAGMHSGTWCSQLREAGALITPALQKGKLRQGAIEDSCTEL